MEIVKEMFNKIIDGFKSFFQNLAREISNSKQVFIKIIVIVVPIIIIIVIINLIVTGVRNGNCYDVRNKIGSYVDSYVMSNNLWPTINGDSVIIDLNNIEKVTFNDKVCSGSVKVTKVNDDYIKTFYLENCSYCSISDFGKETENGIPPVREI